MKRSDYQAMQGELKAVRDEAIAAAEAKFNEAVQALDHLWSLTGDGTSAPAPRGRPKKRGPGRPRTKPASARQTTKKTKKKTRRRRRSSGSGTLIDSMRDAVGKQRGQFTIADVKASLGDQGVSLSNVNPAVLSTTMKRLESLGEIKIVKRGKGRRASVYKKG